MDANGGLDPTFGQAGVVVAPVAVAAKRDVAHALVLQADPRVPCVRALLVGEANGSNLDIALPRLWL